MVSQGSPADPATEGNVPSTQVKGYGDSAQARAARSAAPAASSVTNDH